jgi:hypothetical protein
MEVPSWPTRLECSKRHRLPYRLFTLGSTATVLVTLSAGVAAAPTHAASYNWVAANRRSSPLQEGGIRDFGLWPVLEPVVSLNLSPDCYPSFLEACSGRRSWLIGNLRVRSA